MLELYYYENSICAERVLMTLGLARQCLQREGLAALMCSQRNAVGDRMALQLCQCVSPGIRLVG